VKSESKISNQITIPQEMVDEFIGHLYDDRRVLKTCALVCRAWVPSSRYHLFSSLRLSPSSYGLSFRRLIGHLDHPLCTFASSVRKISIIAYTVGGSPIPFRLDPLIPHLAKLSSVKFLISDEIAGQDTNSFWQALLKSPSFTPQITHLTLHNPLFESFEKCMETIHSFPSLVHLVCDFRRQSDDKWTQDLPAFSGSLPPTLRALGITLSLHPVWNQLMWQWLHRSQTRLSTITIRAVSIRADDITASKLYSFAQYLQFLGPSLEVLQVGFDDAPSICRFLVLSYISMPTKMLD
jgi:hypothetical protein